MDAKIGKQPVEQKKESRNKSTRTWTLDLLGKLQCRGLEGMVFKITGVMETGVYICCVRVCACGGGASVRVCVCMLVCMCVCVRGRVCVWVSVSACV